MTTPTPSRTALVVGASRGIGLAVARHLHGAGWSVLSAARSPCPVGREVRADVSTPQGVEAIRRAVGDAPLDALLYMGGTWEAGAFTDRYRFESCPDDELERVLGVNLLAPIRLAQKLLPALRRAPNPKIVLMGALSGLDNYPAPEVANTASKFGLRGAVHALRNALRHDRVSVTVINPGNVGTPEVLAEQPPDAIDRGLVIPMADLLAVITCVLAVSRATCLKEVHLPAMAAEGA